MKKEYIILLIACTLSSLSACGMSYEDSVVKAHKEKLSNKLPRSVYYLKLSESLAESGHDPLARPYAFKALQYAKKEKNERRIASAAVLIAEFASLEGEADSAVFYLNEAFPHIAKYKIVDQEFKAYQVLIRLNVQSDDLTKSLYFVRKAELVEQGLGNSKLDLTVASLYFLIGQHFDIDSLNSKYAIEVRELLKAGNGTYISTVQSYYTLAHHYLACDEFDKAEKMMNEMRAYAMKNNTSEDHLLYDLKARHHYLMGNIDSSAVYLELVLTLDKKRVLNGKSHRIMGDHTNLTRVYAEMNNPSKFSYHVNKTLEMSFEFGDYSRASTVLSMAVEYYTNLELIDSIAKYNGVLLSVMDSLERETMTDGMQLYYYSTKLETLNLAYESLDTKLVSTSSELEQKRSLSIGLIGAGLLLVLLALWLWVQRKKYKKRSLEMLRLNLELLEKNEVPLIQIAEEERRESNATPISIEIKKNIILGIQTIFDDEINLKDMDLSMTNVASALGTNTNYLSRAIAEEYSSSFSNFVNSHRVSKAMKILIALDFGRFTIESVGYEVGFKSKSTFFSVFKRHTKLSPAQFRKQALMERENQSN